MKNSEAIQSALAKKREERAENEAAYNKKIAEFTEKNREFAAIGDSFKSLGAKLALTALSGGKEELDKLKAQMDELSALKEEMLKNAGIGGIEYSCRKCRDTGFCGDKICDCVKRYADEIRLEELYKKSPAKDNTFENFDLSFYTDEKAKKRMRGIFDLAKNYADDFCGKNSANLLFMGNTGLGKTHLSLAVANVVIKKGYDVLYSPAYNLFAEIETEHFSSHTNTTYDNAVSCDLLIIDDLGGEFVSPYIGSVVYNIINTRLNAGLPTIINTNLSMKEIDEKYTSRVASRLIGEYTAKAFLGQDIRQAKKLKK